ncbi:putative reverse transcriptase domain-containing protein [Tanacetum coccineum]
MQEVILFYNGLDVPTRQILDSKGVIPTKTVADAKVAIQEMAEYSKNGIMEHLGQEVLKLLTDWLQFKHNSTILEEKSRRVAASGFYQRKNANPSYKKQRQLMEESLSKFMSKSAKRHEENFHLIKEIRASTNAAIKNLGASIKTLEIQIKQMSKELAVSVMPLSTYLNLGLGELAHTKLIVELGDSTVKYPKGIAENVLVIIGKFVFPVEFIILDMLEDVKVPLILGRPFLSIAHAKNDMFKRKITLRVGDDVTPPKWVAAE